MNHRRACRAGLLAVLYAIPVAASPIAAAPTSAPASASAPAPASTSRPASIATLAATALGADVTRADEAFSALESSSDPAAREALARVLPQLVARESVAITRAAAVVGDIQRLRAGERELETLRREAWDNLAQFGKRIPGGATAKAGAVEAAHRHYDRLAAVQARLQPAYAAQVQLAEAAVRRGRRVEQWRRVAADAAKAAEDQEESSRLAGVVESALGGMPPDLIAGYEPDPRDEPPADPARRGLWHYLACRRIEAYNRPLEAALLDVQEIQHARLLNAYRERLGVLPLELDARLVQSARRHSREMIDGWYFSHYSPTESLRTWSQRMRAAGYDRPADENLHLGRYEGPAAFWRLFDSPGHHWAMTRPQYTSIGVGRWDLAWTEDFGSGPRLMLVTVEERAKARIIGDVLDPQPVTPRKQLSLEDYRRLKSYDRSGRERAIEGGPGPTTAATARPAR